MGRRIIPTSFPPNTEQVKRTTRPKRFPPGRHSLPVMDHTTPNSSAYRQAGHARAHTHTYTDTKYSQSVVKKKYRY